MLKKLVEKIKDVLPIEIKRKKRKTDKPVKPKVRPAPKKKKPVKKETQDKEDHTAKSKKASSKVSKQHTS